MNAGDHEARLQLIREQVAALLDRHRVLETWTHNQNVRQRELLETLVHRQNLAELHQKLRALHPADLAHVLDALPAADRELVWRELDDSHASAVLPELPRAAREELMATTSPPRLTELLARLDADDFAFVSESIPDPLREEIYKTRDQSERTFREAAAAFEEGTVGSLMLQDFVAVRDSATVGAAIADLRARGELSRHLDALFLVDGRNVLRGVVPLRALLLHDPARALPELMLEHLVAFSPRDRADVAAEAFARYDLVCAPVVDERGKLIGVLPVDEVMDAVRTQTTKDIQKMGGVEALDAPYDEVPFWAMVRKRGGWLSALFLGEMLTATAMGHYEAEIARAVVLALFVPLIISSGGNSGSQAASLIIRALALKELSLRDWARVMQRELLSGATLGALLGAVGFTRIVLWQGLHLTDYGPGYLYVAATIWLSLIGVVCFGTLAGSMLPFLLRRLGFDPATSSAPFVATLVDVTGLVIYFQVASVVLRGTLP